MSILLLLFSCDGKAGESGDAATLPVCPAATVASAGETVGEGDVYEHCVDYWTCPDRTSLDVGELVVDLGLVSERAGCDVWGEFACGPVTKEAGCCYSFVVLLSCGTVE